MHLRFTLAAIAVSAGVAGAAITVNSSSFSGVTSGAVNTAGTADWGYISVAGGFFDSNLGGAGASYSNTSFGTVSNNGGTVLSTVSGASTIGTVTLTEGTTGTDTIGGQGNVSNYTFDGTTAHGSYGNFAPNEANIWQMTFNDLGIGQYEITLYMGHSENNRVFDMDVSFDGGSTTEFTTTSPQIGTLGSTVAAYGSSGSAFTYNIDVTTTSATDDLTLTFGGVSGGFGGAILAGYTVTPIPEPSTCALIGLAGVAVFLRRRR
ncbi:hypothetical protein HAHE_19490 [Haloferula helveola]|uniref:Ice-binding protein C-terminal domain-containing protein n=1 Tax=Haloferula helveola TaxID=490095 RepID=A0ABN6H305_9BACT|nr:hypothetical protein HAHE_19490 [Haloferula helveola]